MSNQVIFVEMLVLMVVNAIGFISMGLDKYAAVRNKERTPEKYFFAVAVLGGGLGVMLGMLFFRHKTRHIAFVAGIPAILAVQALALYFLI